MHTLNPKPYKEPEINKTPSPNKKPDMTETLQPVQVATANCFSRPFVLLQA